jgi:hypothetical protein
MNAKQQRNQGILEDIQECTTMSELKALVASSEEYYDAEFIPAIKEAVKRLRPLNAAVDAPKVETSTVSEMEAKLAAMLTELEALKSGKPAATKPPVVKRAGRKYRLLSTDVSWSTKPQVQAIAAILGAYAKPGDVLDEEDIVGMMVANEAVLKTRQGGKRIWDYYKGMHFEGLEMHKNVETI